MVIRTSLVLDEQLQVLQVRSITVAVIARENEVSLEGMTLLTDVDNLVARAVLRTTRASLQKRGSHKGRQKEEQ